MDQFIIYLILFAIIIAIGQLFNKAIIPVSLILVIIGMILSFIPGIPSIEINPNLVLNVFLPILVYQISSFSSWIDVKKSARPIALLSIGHVIFITFLVAFVIHWLIPGIGWPMAFILGAVLSPPDDVAIVSIAEKIHMPHKVVTILQGEGLFNDATALVLFKFALAALLVQEFSAMHAVSSFFIIIIGEILYGLLVGHVIGKLRLYITNSKLYIISALLTPFIAYLPPEMLGGSGILATVIAGFIIGNRYSPHYQPEYRLVSFAMWPALAFTIQSLLFLLVGLDFRLILQNISTIPLHDIFIYSLATILTLILGRFFWVYVFVYFLPRALFPSLRKKEPSPPWQYPFIVSWAGMRGSISLAAALAVPFYPMVIEGSNPKALLLFLVFLVIVFTFILQGLTLPWLLKKLGIKKIADHEAVSDHITELSTRVVLVNAVLQWLLQYRKEVADDPKMLEEVKLHIQQYRLVKENLRERILNHNKNDTYNEQKITHSQFFIVTQIIEVERSELVRLWQTQKISLALRNKLMTRLDHHSRHITP